MPRNAARVFCLLVDRGRTCPRRGRGLEKPVAHSASSSSAATSLHASFLGAVHALSFVRNLIPLSLGEAAFPLALIAHTAYFCGTAAAATTTTYTAPQLPGHVERRRGAT